MEISSSNLDHLGIVAGQCKTLKIAERVDSLMGKKHGSRVVSCGQAVVVMILNGLGFGGRRLYLTPQFFATKPVDKLIGPGIHASQLDDHCLGKALDEIADYGSSRLFGELAMAIGIEHDLFGPTIHLDTTSISVEGEYKTSEKILDRQEAGEKIDESEAGILKITHGYSKDKRPDLKQLMIALCVTGESEFPIHYESQDGNSSDKKTFDPILQAQVKTFKEQLKDTANFRYVADSALYSKTGLLAHHHYTFISRVPETITEAVSLLEQDDQLITWVEYQADKNYRLAAYDSEYGGIKQRYILVHSDKAFSRESKTFMRELDKQENQMKKKIQHLQNQVFGCELDIKKEVKRIEKEYPYHQLTCKVQSVEKHSTKGRPKKTATKVKVGFQMTIECSRNQTAIDHHMRKKGRFILATNELNAQVLKDEQILKEYKAQQNVERGFRFLKDPYFMADSLFLKSERRIDALMMVMTLCLMVYNITQFQIRKKLKETKETIPNQINRPINNPTLRWVFQIMEGIGFVTLSNFDSTQSVQHSVTNLTPLRKKIIHLLSPEVVFIYSS